MRLCERVAVLSALGHVRMPPQAGVPGAPGRASAAVVLHRHVNWTWLLTAGDSMAGSESTAGGRALAVPPRRCTCRRGYGGAGCNVAVPRLAAGQMVERTIPADTWLHFQINVSAFPAPPWCLRTGSFRSKPSWFHRGWVGYHVIFRKLASMSTVHVVNVLNPVPTRRHERGCEQGAKGGCSTGCRYQRAWSRWWWR